jgi:hypothetical protein
LKDALLAEIRKQKVVFYNTVVAQAQAIDAGPDRVTFTFAPAQRTLQNVFDQNRGWLETVARKLTGRQTVVASAQGAVSPPAGETAGPDDTPSGGAAAPDPDRKAALRERAMADAGVQALLEVFPVEIRDVEEM